MVYHNARRGQDTGLQESGRGHVGTWPTDKTHLGLWVYFPFPDDVATLGHQCGPRPSYNTVLPVLINTNYYFGFTDKIRLVAGRLCRHVCSANRRSESTRPIVLLSGRRRSF